MTHENDTFNTVRGELVRRFGADHRTIRVVRAPYRVCPLGAHIDHQDGPVTAMAIDRSVLLAYAPSGTREVRLESRDFAGRVEFSIEAIPPRDADHWGNYPRGAALALQGRFPLREGLVGVTSGSLHGGGVSSSAAVGVAFLLALEDVNQLDVTAEENILLDQDIENRYLGLHNGILDQSAILLSRRGHLTRIDCASRRHELISPPHDMPRFRILLVFSGVQRSLVGTEYNRRVDECTTAARRLLGAAGRSGCRPVLANLTAEEYSRYHDLLDGAPARRAAHFFSEVDRVEKGTKAWRDGDLAAFGSLVSASGESSIRNYECGSPPLISLVRILNEIDGVLGARFSGAGFRGCCVALVEPGRAERIAARVLEQYADAHPDLAGDASSVLCDSDDGAELLTGASEP